VVIPALSLGFGVAFLLFGSRLLPTAGPTALSRAAFVSIVWLLVNWWPHSNFHRVANGWTNIVLVDYFFHTTVIVATCVVAAYFMSVLRQRRAVDEMQSDARHMAPTLTT
jgi:C4-dicarboxylate transporter